MRVGRFILWTAAISAAAWVHTQSAAQSRPPRSLDTTIIANKAPSEADRAAIAQWGGFWVRQLATGDVVQTEDAREKLLHPLGHQFNPSPAFRDTYSRALDEPLRAILESSESGAAHRAINCILVLQELGTADALTLLQDQSDLAKQSAWHVRLRAAFACGAVLEAAGRPAPPYTFSERTIDTAARTLGALARAETNPLVLRHLLEALGKINAPAGRASLVDTLSHVVDRLERAQQAPNAEVEAVHVAVVRLRDAFAILPANQAAERRSISERLTPALVKLLSLTKVHWTTAQDQPQYRRTYGAAIETIEPFLKLLNDELLGAGKSPGSALYAAWDRKDRPKYEADLNQWASIVGQPPYKKN
jgi:hypothetical protein